MKTAGTADGQPLPEVTIHTDGGCQGNPGVGAWACVLHYGGQRWELSGGVPATTNNRMELQAAIQALKALNRRCQVTLFTDSNYLRDGITKWVAGWKRNGWRTADKQPVKNRDQWMELDGLAARHSIAWQWLRGHVGHRWNERCDALANEAMQKVRRDYTRDQLRAALEEFVRENEASAKAAPSARPLF